MHFFAATTLSLACRLASGGRQAMTDSGMTVKSSVSRFTTTSWAGGRVVDVAAAGFAAGVVTANGGAGVIAGNGGAGVVAGNGGILTAGMDVFMLA